MNWVIMITNLGNASSTRTKLGVLFSFWRHLWKECNRHIFMAKSAQSLSSQRSSKRIDPYFG
jgi:hypothetical protein